MSESNKSIISKLNFKPIDTKNSGVDKILKSRRKFISDLTRQNRIASAMIENPGQKPAGGELVLFKPDPDGNGGFYLDLRYGRKRVRLNGDEYVAAKDLREVKSIYQMLIDATEAGDPGIDAALSAATEIGRKATSQTEPDHKEASSKGPKART